MKSILLIFAITSVWAGEPQAIDHDFDCLAKELPKLQSAYELDRAQKYNDFINKNLRPISSNRQFSESVIEFETNPY